MKDAAVQNSAARSAVVDSPLNDSGRVDALLSQRRPNTQRRGAAALEQRRERTRNHLAKIAARRETGIKRNRYYYGLLNRLLRSLVKPQKKVLSVLCLSQAKRTQLFDPDLWAGDHIAYFFSGTSWAINF